MTKTDPDDEFTPRALKGITGLSSRQLNEWDSRDALPSQREGERGWRRSTMSQAIALAILAGVKRTFGTPVNMLKPLLSWMQGEVLTVDGLTARRRAEDHLQQYTQAELDESNDKFAELKAKGRVRFVEAPKDGLLLWGDEPNADVEAALIQAAVEMTVPRLVARGWQKLKARDFCEIFFKMSGGRFAPERVLGEFIRLARLADDAKDRIARQATQMLCSGLAPIVGAIGAMSGGMPIYLVTDLTTSRFVDEFTLTEFARAGLLRGDYVSLYVNDLVNEVLQRAGRMPMNVRFEPAASKDERPGLTDREKQLIALLREGDFKRATVTPKGERYQVEIEKTSPAREIKKIIAMIQKRGYHQVVVKKHNDEISYVVESETRTLG